MWERMSIVKIFVPNGTNESKFCRICIFRRPYRTDIGTSRLLIRTNKLVGYYHLIPSGSKKWF